MQLVPIFPESKEVSDLRKGSAFVVQSLCDNYSAILGGIPGITVQTKKTYLSNVIHFIQFIQLNGIHAHTFGEFRNELDTVDKTSKTKNAYLTSAKVLIREALKYRIMPVDITANVPGFKENKGHVKDGLMPHEVKKVAGVIRYIPKETTRAKITAMFELFTAEGFRQIEVTRLKLQDFNAKDGFILVHGKGKHDKKKHYIKSHTVKSIARHIEVNAVKDGFIFAGRAGKQLTTRAIQKAFTHPQTGVFARAGIEKTVHGFRHFMITKTLKETNGNITKTKKLARLESIETLIKYDDDMTNRQTVNELEDSFLEFTVEYN
jgi:integrase/recombinase XerC